MKPLTNCVDTYILKIDIDNLYKISSDYFFNNENMLSENAKDQITEIASKYTIKSVNDLLMSFSINIEIKNILEAQQSFSIENISNVPDLDKLYLFYKIYVFHKHQLKIMNINIHISTYHKSYSEINKFTTCLLFLAKHCNKGKTVDIEKIENYIPENKKSFFKGVRKSILYSVLKIKTYDTYRCHPDSKNRIIYPSELDSKKYELRDKKVVLNCPICGGKHEITTKTINTSITFKKSKVSLNCNHDSSSYIKELPFSINLEKYTYGLNLSKEKAQIFFINNLKRLSDETQ